MELFSNQDGRRVFRRMAERSPHAVLRHFPELSGLAGIGRCPATRFPDGYFCCDLVRIDGRDGRFPVAAWSIKTLITNVEALVIFLVFFCKFSL